MSEFEPKENANIDPALLLPPSEADIKNAVMQIDSRLEQSDIHESINTEAELLFGKLYVDLKVGKNYNADEIFKENDVSIYVSTAESSEDPDDDIGLLAIMPFKRNEIILNGDEPNNDVVAQGIGKMAFHFTAMLLDCVHGKVEDPELLITSHDAILYLLEDTESISKAISKLSDDPTHETEDPNIEDIANEIRQILDSRPIPHRHTHNRAFREKLDCQDGQQLMVEYTQETEVDPQKNKNISNKREIVIQDSYPALDGDFEVEVIVNRKLVISGDETPYILISSNPNIPVLSPISMERRSEYNKHHRDNSVYRRLDRKTAAKVDLIHFLGKLRVTGASQGE